MAATKELAQAPAKAAPGRQPEVARRGPEPAPAAPVFSTQARSNGIPAAARAAELTSAPGGTAGRARMASSLQRSLGNARMARMMAHGGPAVRPGAGGAGKIPSPTQEKLEHTFGSTLDFVDVHAGGAAAEANRRMGSRAFAHGHEIYLGPGESAHDTALMAHEVAHVFQQQGGGAAVQRKGGASGCAYEREADRAAAAALRSEPITIHERTRKHRPQFFGLGQALDWLADKANIIPGYRMFTIVLGVNPINMSPVERSAGNILRAIIEFIPGGGLIVQVADAYGAFDKVANWVQPQITAVAGAASSIKSAVSQFLDSLKLSDILDLGGVWDRAKAIFTTPVNRVLNVAKGLLSGILALFRDIILMPLVGLAQKTRGWDLLIAVLGKNPINGEAVPRTAETLVPGFLKLIGEEETWNNIKKANALARIWAWFQGALGAVMGFVQQVPTLFINALKSLELEDILLLPRAFAKVAVAFGDFIGKFITWAGQALWNLLQIIFEVVAPGAIPYLKKVGAAFQKILKNPMGFVGNLVKAGKQGFMQFADHIGAHLKASFIEWLTGSLDGVYIPKSFDFKEIAKFVLSVLGLTWDNIRKILVKIAGEPAVKAMEVGFDIVKTLVTEGPAAAWEKIKEQLANLKDMVVQGIMDFIIETVVKKAVVKIISWLIPGAGFIDAIITIYDTIKVLIDKMKKIIQVGMAFLDGIVNIANGVIGAAANKVETTLAGLLTLAISFLAGVVGLNKVTDKVNDVINTKVRSPILKGLEFVATWIWNMAKKLFSKIFGKKEEKDDRTDQQKQADLDKAVEDGEALISNKALSKPERDKELSRIKAKYKLASISVVIDNQTATDETDHVHAEINPVKDGKPIKKPAKSYLGCKKSGDTFTGNFDSPEWASKGGWTGYPSHSVALHPAYAVLGYQSNKKVSKPSGEFTVSGQTKGVPAPEAWRNQVLGEKEAFKRVFLQKGLGGEAENAAKAEVVRSYQSRWPALRTWQDVFLLKGYWEGHHIKPVNWSGTDDPENIQYLTVDDHAPFRPWFEAKKKEIMSELNKP